MTLKPLGRVKELVESLGMGISYAYEDLVFLKHNAFILQFGQDERSIIVHMNQEAVTEQITENIAQLENGASAHDLQIIHGSSYNLHSVEDETITIEFNDEI